MKKIIISSLLLVLALNAFTQRKVEETYTVPAGQKIKLDLRFAEEIQLMQWNSSELKVSASVNIDEGAGNEAYNLKTETTGDTYIIKDDYGDYLEKKRHQNNCNTSIRISYVIHVPANAHLAVKSISGSLSADDFQGQLETELISGNVEIKRYKGTLKLKTVSGNLDIAMNKANVDAKTVTGTIYSNLDIDIKNKTARGITSHIKGVINNGTDLVKLETVSGNIYMRKD